MPDVEGPLVGPVPGHRVVELAQEVGRAGQRLRIRDALGHGRLVLDAFVLALEGRDHRQDGHAFLVGMDPAGGEGPAIPQALDAEGDGLVGIARPQEVSVHGMDVAFRVHRPDGGDERLGQDLAAEDPLVRLLLGRPQEDVLVGPGPLQLAKVQEVDER